MSEQPVRPDLDAIVERVSEERSDPASDIAYNCVYVTDCDHDVLNDFQDVLAYARALEAAAQAVVEAYDVPRFDGMYDAINALRALLDGGAE